MAIQRLTAAYRSRSRPSSTPGAKASTVCPSYLDGDHALGLEGPNAMVIPVRTALCEAVLRWHDCAVFKVREEKAHARDSGGRSLKTQQHEPAIERAPGPVDIRYRVELESRGMRNWPSPALQVLELP